MIEVRPYDQLGGANHGWLKTKHHFSFADYYDPNRMHWGNLRVWNHDIILPQSGFPMHPHKDMEIITYVYEGAITHTDSMGNRGVTKAGDVQIMSAGTGVAHSEYNLEQDAETKLFQIWIIPEKKDQQPTWGSKAFPKAERKGSFSVLASGYEEDQDALRIQTKGRVLAVTLQAGQETSYQVTEKNKLYLVAAKGHYQVNDHQAFAFDGVAIKDEQIIKIKAMTETEIVMVEV